MSLHCNWNLSLFWNIPGSPASWNCSKYHRGETVIFSSILIAHILHICDSKDYCTNGSQSHVALFHLCMNEQCFMKTDWLEHEFDNSKSWTATSDCPSDNYLSVINILYWNWRMSITLLDKNRYQIKKFLT